MKFPRPSPSVFANCKRSKTGGVEGLGTRLRAPSFKDKTSVVGPHASKGCAPVLGVPLAYPLIGMLYDRRCGRALIYV